MPKRAKIPEGQEYRDAWAKLDRTDRRRIMRGVNRAQALEKRNEAALAVTVARGQQRFWRFGWLAGPLLAGFLQWGQELMVIVVNVLLATVLFGALAFFFTRRARRAEQANLAVVEGRKKK